MPKMTKTQAKRAYESILNKASKLFMSPVYSGYRMSTKDYEAIERIILKNMKKF